MLKRVVFGLIAILLMGTLSSAWAFNLTDTQGHGQSLAAYKGKWVLVNFWATWCPPCRAEIPDLIALHNANISRLAVIGIAMDYDDPKQVIGFAHDMHINYPIVLGNETVANQIGQVEGLPTSYLYNPEGKIVATQVGGLTRAVVEDYINSHTTSHSKKK